MKLPPWRSVAAALRSIDVEKKIKQINNFPERIKGTKKIDGSSCKDLPRIDRILKAIHIIRIILTEPFNF